MASDGTSEASKHFGTQQDPEVLDDVNAANKDKSREEELTDSDTTTSSSSSSSSDGLDSIPQNAEYNIMSDPGRLPPPDSSTTGHSPTRHAPSPAMFPFKARYGMMDPTAESFYPSARPALQLENERVLQDIEANRLRPGMVNTYPPFAPYPTLPDPVVDQGSSITPASARQEASAHVDSDSEDKEECLVCTGLYSPNSLATLACNHKYCKDCVKRLVEYALNDESLFPPQCCHRPIPVEAVRSFLSPLTIVRFAAKKLELETPDRTYCWVPRCSAFIPNYNIRAHEARCPVCQAKTCTQCKKQFHENQDCPTDEATQATLKLASELGWKKCYACHRLVELNDGCYHISTSFPLFSSLYLTVTAPVLRLLTWPPQQLANAVPNSATCAERFRKPATAGSGAMTNSKRPEYRQPLRFWVSLFYDCGHQR